MNKPVATPEITNEDYWFKVVDFLQHNWAVIQPSEHDGCKVYFFGDTSGIFDTLNFLNQTEAEVALKRNGFKLYADDSEAQQFIAKPRGSFEMRNHPNGSIYSSGRFWR